ncbi:hypothetical protein B0H15DRAFT_515560 [Mycena belliarum]|uniref:Zinc finger PHD-type domain-containing protein n=1 Tax=Mycena belliarum TaxID=1033014 RepID=A0AAD6UF94_9AGAR|nr:hypothetical protein B0H15DRAFT_515560 [Mycena belliae]
MESLRSDPASKVASPQQPPSAAYVVPSSVTPSPMLGAQVPKSSPPPLTLSIPQFVAPAAASNEETAHLPGTSPQAEYIDFLDTMSPLSPATPSTRFPSESPSPPPHPLIKIKREAIAAEAAPPPRGRPSTSILKLKATGQPGVSAAATRIKKRKGPPREREPDSSPEPPLKRARQRSEKPVKQEKGKGKSKAGVGPAPALPLVWPAMTAEKDMVPELVGKFVGCDKCERWYHATCLGFVADDPRIEGTYYCPPCAAGNAAGAASGIEDQCSHPHCPVPEKFFEPRGVYGRRYKLDATLGRVTLWLVFWKGYAWSDATWEPEAPQNLIKRFVGRAMNEGTNLDGDGCVLLQEARHNGAVDPDLA